MRKLAKPAHGAREVFEKCNAHVDDQAKRASLLAFAPQVESAAASFDLSATLQNLHELRPLPPISYVTLGISANDLKAAYDSRMVRGSAASRAIYNELLTAAQFDRCPYCSQRRVATLDHFLPKTHYPELSVAPVNLVPACWECNHGKRQSVAPTADEVSLHPYYDDVDNDRWLFARVAHSNPIALVFYPDPPMSWLPTLQRRLQQHFKDFKLGPLYGAEAAREIVGISKQMRRLNANGGAAAVRLHLIEARNSNAEIWPNDWKTAMYDALAADPAYHSNPE